ncbi:MAG: NAD(P)/FAD-dependent oxidoreductase [Armatimonadota bacterium]
MRKYNYLIIGGSIAADSAIKAIRKEDKDGTIGMLSDESVGPYRRPALSKQAWEPGGLDRIWLNTEKQNVDMYLSTRAVSIDKEAKTVTDASGELYGYDKLLIATGSRPRKLPFGEDLIYYRNLDDFHRLHSTAERVNEFVILGGGFTGLELASCLMDFGKKVTMVFPEKMLGSLVFPEEISCYLHNYYLEKGVELIPSELPVDVIKSGDKYEIKMDSGKSIVTDAVIASIGCIPNAEVASESGIEVTNGIIVDEMLMCGPDIFAAGDVANFYNPILKKRMRIEHSDNAVNMGRHAGMGMLGHMEPYNYMASFYASMFDINFKAIGELNPRMTVEVEWKEPLKEGVLQYIDDNHIRGVLFWNVPAQFDFARSLMAKSNESSTY